MGKIFTNSSSAVSSLRNLRTYFYINIQTTYSLVGQVVLYLLTLYLLHAEVCAQQTLLQIRMAGISVILYIIFWINPQCAEGRLHCRGRSLGYQRSDTCVACSDLTLEEGGRRHSVPLCSAAGEFNVFYSHKQKYLPPSYSWPWKVL